MQQSLNFPKYYGKLFRKSQKLAKKITAILGLMNLHLYYVSLLINIINLCTLNLFFTNMPLKWVCKL